jgi:membrane protease YdiL (CAAX protease family)
MLLVCILFTLALLTQYQEYKKTGKIYGAYPWRISTFFSSIYEEIIFRGFALFGFLYIFSPILSVLISSTLFGLFHLKNYKWLTKKQLTYQVIYTTLFGFVLSIITLMTGTIWIAVIVHYCNNLAANIFRK